MTVLPFTIYNASAGSGKTYTLVKEYLKVLLSSESNHTFQQVLAITFTNKAVTEMKTRVLKTLREFAKDSILNEANDMFQSICQELGYAPMKVHQKSKAILEAILHNYGAFEISTIDGFTHRVIRTFARDLKLSLNFEVELDTDNLLVEAVDRLLSKAGEDPLLTSVLVEYALEKLDDDRSWDISYDLNDIAKLLLKENNLVFLETLKNKSLEDFMTLKVSLQKTMEQLEQSIKSKAANALLLISDSSLDHSDFNRGYLPKHFVNLAEGHFDINFENKWQLEIDSKPLYPSRVTGSTALEMDRIQPQLATIFFESRDEVYNLNFYKNVHKNITPLSVLNRINKELDELQDEENKLLISEFNTIISKEIKNQPTPFIYERLGEKFKHYFIDEFQDTSILQWENLKPLIANSIEQEQNERSGTLLLVGDAKQAIYRWRGGEADQFIKLYDKSKEPFQVKQKVKSLEANYRSSPQIVEFNNDFFSFVSEKSFSNPSYGSLYEEAKQNIKSSLEGYVRLSFLDISKEDDKDEPYCNATLKTVQECESLNYDRGDICVLVRKNKEGVQISKHLMENGIQVVSADTLLLSSSKKVVFLVNMLSLLVQPKNLSLKADVLYFIATRYQLEDIHGFLEKNLSKDLRGLFLDLKDLGVEIVLEELVNQPLYDTVESLVRSLGLIKTSDAFIQFFMDEVLNFTQKNSNNIQDFLDYFEKKKDSLTVTSSENNLAVKVMTIHKAKGLEFPVVIFPYADLDIHRELNPQIWYPLENGQFHGFPYALINYKKELTTYGPLGKALYDAHQAELELDNLNLLYVALTRPKEKLFVISKREEKPSLNTYSGLFIEYLKNGTLWQEDSLTYEFGNLNVKGKREGLEKLVKVSSEFISSPKNSHPITIVTKSGFLWDTAQGEAIEKGNLIHAILANIKTIDDVQNALDEFISDGTLNIEQSEALSLVLSNIVEHDALKEYFLPELKQKVLNEQEVITRSGEIYRPDRMILEGPNEIVLMDYKTGEESVKHYKQVETYETILSEMGFNVAKKILVYINEEITVKEL